MAQPLAATIAQPPADPAQSVSAYRWVIAWVILLAVLFLIAKWKIGYTIIYYLLLLAAVFVVLTQYQAITSLLSPFSQGAKNA